VREARHAACFEQRRKKGGWRMRFIQILLAVAASLMLGGCELIGNIFEAGIWTGIILVVVVVALIGFAISKSKR
jgi:hypothetical protein